jgi:hypothetical protein
LFPSAPFCPPQPKIPTPWGFPDLNIHQLGRHCGLLQKIQNNAYWQKTLGTTEEEKDVGIYVNPSLKPGMHCKKAANKAMAILKQITNCFHYWDRKVFLKLYKQYRVGRSIVD